MIQIDIDRLYIDLKNFCGSAIGSYSDISSIAPSILGTIDMLYSSSDVNEMMELADTMGLDVVEYITEEEISI